jgi:septum formation topological specificity factor MinE
MIFHKTASNIVAKERLRLMIETEALEQPSEDIIQLKKEISCLVGRYFNVSPDMFEIKITLKQDKKRD